MTSEQVLLATARVQIKSSNAESENCLQIFKIINVDTYGDV